MTSSPSPSPAGPSQALDTRRPKSAQNQNQNQNQNQTVSVNIAEASGQNGARRFQLQVSECVETKTVTTTTRLTRKFPHVFVRDPTPLSSLDAKEYPLASKPTPPELNSFTFTVPRGRVEDEEVEEEDDYIEQGAHHGPKSVSYYAQTESTNRARSMLTSRLLRPVERLAVASLPLVPKMYRL